MRTLNGIPGTPPDLRRPPAGCPFHPRCARRTEGCDERLPALLPVGPRPGHEAACLLNETGGGTGGHRTHDETGRDTGHEQSDHDTDHETGGEIR
ncbi:oligopeptide transporter ATP-binding component [Streptomyces sp. S4.7]|nr:oligopeptide transporter ATP-binding component [Streptomyces sp. S4.7]